MKRLAVLVVLAAASAVGAEPSFTILPQVADPSAGGNTAYGISADGSTVVGNTFGPTQAFRWNAAIGTVPLFGVMPFISNALDASSDGSVVVGTLITSNFGQPPFMNEAWRWTQAGGLQHLGYLPGATESYAPAISDDGTIIVGSSRFSNVGYQAFRWTAAGGMVGLGVPAGSTSSSAEGISGDGTTIVGAVGSGSGAGAVSQAVYWTEATGFVGIGTLMDPASGTAVGVDASTDGSVIVGQSRSPNGQFEAFRWTAGGGMVGLGDLPGGTFQSLATAVSGDGSIVIGQSDAGRTGRDAFFWDEAHGMRFLVDVLAEQGLDMTGLRIQMAEGISKDGTTITGDGFVAVIPEPGHAALLGSGALALVLLRRLRNSRLDHF